MTGAIRGNLKLFYTWGSILGSVIAGAVNNQTPSRATVFIGMTIARPIEPWGECAQRNRLGRRHAGSLSCIGYELNLVHPFRSLKMLLLLR